MIAAVQAGANHLGAPDGTAVDVAREFFPAGQGVGAIHELVPAGELVRRMVAEAEQAIGPRASRGATPRLSQLAGRVTMPYCTWPAGTDRRRLGRRHRADPVRLHHHPERVAELRRRLGRARPHGGGRRADQDLVRQRGRSPGSPSTSSASPGRTPVIVCEVPGHRRRRRRPHRPALRPPRQAAGDDRLARRPGAVDAGGRGRPPLRAGRGRRRLRRLRLAAGHRGR